MNEDVIDKEAFVQDTNQAILGSLNGILLHDLIWPYLVIIIFRLILQDRYEPIVKANESLMSIIMNVIVALITLSVFFLIVKPKILLKAYKKIQGRGIALIFTTFAAMLAFSYAYNFFIYVMGVDIAGGNANQENVVNMMYSAPVLSFIFVVIIAPIIEEITYRYFLFGGIAKYNRKWAIVISGFIFMCVHAVASFTSGDVNIVRELLLLPPYMFSGMALAYAYNKSSNLAVSTSIHALNNLISFILSFL